jgi:phage terminase large subunit GpA-like protein
VNGNALVAATMPGFAPPPDLTVSQWAEHHRRLPASSASSGARWSNATTPYLVEIQDAACDPAVRRLVVMGASQVGKSEALHNVVGYWVQHDPSTLLWLMPSFEDAKRRSRGALADMIRSTPSLRTIVRGRRAPRGAHENESTLLEKVYPGGSLILAGSGTPNSFAGVSARRAIADEFERFAAIAEGAPDVLLTNRTSAFYDGFVAFLSTPLLVDGKIHQQFKLTDQRRYFLRCEACGHEAYTAWQDAERFHVTYRDKDPDSARLTCPGCDVAHDEAARRRMVAAGQWRPTAEPVDATARGYHLPATISTLGDVTLSRLVAKWLAARASGPAALMSFVNTVLAEPWEDRGARVEPHALAARLEHYGDGIDAPAGVVCLTAGVDVQIDRFEVSIFGWGRGSEAWVVDSHVVPGDPTSADVQAALLAALDERYVHADGHRLPIVLTAIDAGYLPERVAYALAARRPRRIIAVKGVGGRFGEPSILKFDPNQPPAALNVDGLKLETALGLELAAPGPGYLHLSRRCCDEEYLAQLCAEHRETKRRNGVATMVWVEDRPRNEALDTAVYARAALKLLTRLSGARTEDSMLTRMADRLRSHADA